MNCLVKRRNLKLSKIKVGQTEIKVKGFYPFRYQTGKLCIRFDVNAEEVNFQTLYALLHNNSAPIEYYENEEAENPVVIYHSYSEFTCQYQNGIYAVEQVAPSVSDSILADLQAQANQMRAVIQEQSQVINNQATMLDVLAECALDMSAEVYKDSETVLTKESIKEMIQESQCEMIKKMLNGFAGGERK